MTVLVGKTVLIVDDDVRSAYALGRILAKHGMDVHKAASGEEALEILKEYSDVNIVLMDLMIPGMDGYEAIREIRSRAQLKRFPIIAITASAEVGLSEKCFVAGASGFLTKPIDAEQLLSVMAGCLYDK